MASTGSSADPSDPATPTAAEVAEVVGVVPLLSAYFRRARSDMPDSMRAGWTEDQLGPRHGAVLVQLVAGDPLSVGELAGRLGSSLSTASELVGQLARTGWINRSEDPRDRRRTLVTLSAERRSDFEAFITTRSAPLLRALDRLTPDERAGFVRGLRLWVHESHDRREQ